MNYRIIIFFACLVLASLILPVYYVTLFNYIGLASIVALGLVLITGIGGILSFGQAAFVGVGAYTTAHLTTVYGISPWLTLLISLVLAGLIAWILGAITLRLSGHYLPIGTIAWGLCLYQFFANYKAFGGHNGISGIPRLSIAGYEINSQQQFFYLIWFLLAVALITVQNLLNSRVGRAIRSLRDGGQMARAFGVDTAAAKQVIFVHAAVLAALSGWLFAHFGRFVNPSTFNLSASIDYLFMAVVGGAASVWGAVVGAGLFTVLSHWLQDLLPQIIGRTGQFEIIVFGLLLLILFRFAPEGVMPLLFKRFLRPNVVRVPPAAPALPTRPRPAAGDLLLEVRGARKEFDGLVAVDDVSFDLRAGEILGLIGPNGAGKTTMFNLITSILPLTRGQIVFRGQRIDKLAAYRIVDRGIARTFQHVKLQAGMSALENVALGAHRRGKMGYVSSAFRLDRADEAALLSEAKRQLDRVGLGDGALNDVSSFPLGQQRLLEVARTLAADPTVLLLDEPGAGLRHREKEALANLLRELKQEGFTILLVEHDMDLVMGLVDRLVVMDFGRKIAEGTPEQIRADPAVIEAYLGAPK